MATTTTRRRRASLVAFIAAARSTATSSGRFHAVASIILALLVVETSLGDPAFVPCFDELNHPPLCHYQIKSNNNTDFEDKSAAAAADSLHHFEVNSLCFDLEIYYLDDDTLNVAQHIDKLSQLSADDAFCHLYRQVYPICWWCKEPSMSDSDYCTMDSFCVNDSPDTTALSQEQLNATCSELDILYNQDIWPATIDFCDRLEQASYECPIFCDYSYLGAHTTQQKRALVWMSRVGAILAFLGASYILWDSLYHANHRTTVYHQLLIGMACFDIVTAAAWSLATVPIPTSSNWHVVGTKGNVTTCNLQAFFVQLGYTSLFYNVSLALYYVLVIVYSWRENALKTIRVYLHGIPTLLGFGLAFGGLAAGVYDWIEYGCHLVPPPEGDVLPAVILAVVPICVSIASITVLMLMVYVSVRRKSRSARKWRLGFGRSGALEQRVFWQALFYTLSFYVTWPILLGVYARSLDSKYQSYAYSITVAFVAPLQGFNNFLVYVRPKTHAWDAFERFSSAASRFIRWPNRESQLSSDNEPQSTAFGEKFDPSVQIAKRDSPVGTRRDSPIREPVARMELQEGLSEDNLGVIDEANDNCSPRGGSFANPSELSKGIEEETHHVHGVLDD